MDSCEILKLQQRNDIRILLLFYNFIRKILQTVTNNAQIQDISVTFKKYINEYKIFQCEYTIKRVDLQNSSLCRYNHDVTC